MGVEDRNFSRIEDIFRVVTPVDAAGGWFLKGSSGIDANLASELLTTLIAGPAGGALPYQAMLKKLSDLSSGSDEAEKKIAQIVHIFAPDTNLSAQFGLIDPALAGYYKVLSDGKEIDVNSNDIVGKSQDGSFSTTMAQRPISIATIDAPFIHPATRYSDKVETFLNFMPSYHMARCVPYLEVEIAYSGPSALLNDKVNIGNGMNMLRFLMGGVPEDQLSDVDKVLARSRLLIEDNAVQSTSGMEMFTSPFTLTNVNPVEQANRFEFVKDPFRPLASIESFNINVAPTVGLFSYKKATLNIILHERSRLAEISEAVRPQVYKDTCVWVTYGWRHPFEPNNPYSEFINKNMLVREAYGVNNVSITFDQYGQAKIALSLHMLAGNQLQIQRVDTTGDTVANLYEQLRTSAERVKQIRAELGLEVPEGSSVEIRPYKLLSAAENMDFSLEPKRIQQQIADLHTSLRKGGYDPEKVQELATILREMYDVYSKSGPLGAPPSVPDALMSVQGSLQGGSAPKGGIIGDVTNVGKNIAKNAVANAANGFRQNFTAYTSRFLNQELGFTNADPTAVARRYGEPGIRTKFTNLLTTPDPFLLTDERWEKIKDGRFSIGGKVVQRPGCIDNITNYRSGRSTDTKRENRSIPKGEVVSFGKLVSVFLGDSIKSLVGIDEAQMFFYRINDSALGASGINIAEFPIDYNMFVQQYALHAAQNGSLNMSVEAFIRLLIDAQINDERNLAYGLREFYAPYDPQKPEAVFVTGPKGKTTDDAQRRYDDKLLTSKFKKPVVDCYVETVYSFVPFDGDSTNVFDPLLYFTGNRQTTVGTYKRLLRIHVFDKQLDPFPLAGAVLNDISGRASGATLEEIVDAQNNILENYNRPFYFDSEGRFRVQENGRKAKDIISQFLPTITFGTNGSMLKEVNVTSQQDNLISTIHMQNVKISKVPAAGPNGSGVGGQLPLRVIPMNVSVKAMGCPLLQFGQQFFFDFGSGTTIDNKYLITGLNHTISKASFTSEITLTFADAYGVYESEASRTLNALR